MSCGVKVGDLEDVRYANGQLHTVRVLALDTISQPPRARVCRCDNHEIMVVQMVEMLLGSINGWRGLYLEVQDT